MKNPTDACVVAFYPFPRGLGFSVFYGADTPIDWGVRRSRRWSKAKCIDKVAEILDYYQPDTIVLEHFDSSDSRRSLGAQHTVEALATFADNQGYAVIRLSKRAVQDVFVQYSCASKYDIAHCIQIWLPEFGSVLPPKRKRWDREDYRMTIFSSAALALTYFYTNS